MVEKAKKKGRSKPRRANVRPQGTKNGTCPGITLSEIFEMAVADIRPAVVNDVVYGVIKPEDKSLDDLVVSMAEHGQLETIVVSLDNVAISGHRRLAAAKWLGWKHLKARRYPILSTDPNFEKVLVSYNTQRDKDPATRMREQLVLTDPEKAYQAIASERAKASQVSAETLVLGHRRRRPKISKAKRPFLDAICRVVDSLKSYWPVSDRKVHYELLNDPPLIHARKGETYIDHKGILRHNRYRNDHKSYKATCELLTRARIDGLIPFDAIGDETRPVITWDVHPNVTPFIRREVDNFCKGYARDLMQGQPCHVEIIGEKLTVEAVVRPVAMRFRIPYTIGRGYSSLPPRKAMYDRFMASGKDWLFLLFLSDHDPEGWDIAETFAKSMRDDFGLENVSVVKVGLKPEQVEHLNLPPNEDAKKTSSRFNKFAARFGPAAYELEAVPMPTLKSWLDEEVRKVINIDAFNAQVEMEKKDSATVVAFKKEALDYLKRMRPE
jgi:hypothetical protein